MMRLLLPAMIALTLSGCLSQRAVRQTDVLAIEMLFVEGGSFRMGDAFEFSNEDALPIHRIEVASFYLARFETTFEQYDAFALRTGRPLPVPEEEARGPRAVVGVSWQDAVDFCAFVDSRLPTESEWEYAAAGGDVKQKYAGTSDEASVDAYLSYRENSNGRSQIVGLKEPNAFGLYDMSGNVGEWVEAYYEKYPAPGETPLYNDLETRDLRIVRGGGISSELPVTRTYWRAGTLKDVRSPSVGFRCAMDVE